MLEDTYMANRKQMDEALKTNVIPYLRANGFKGSFPHFRRRNKHQIDLITFQFNRYGGSFIVELAVCPLDGITMSWGQHIPPNKVTAHDVNTRYRLSENNIDDYWFQYENAENEADYHAVAKSVISLLKIEDTSWISSFFD